MKKIIIGTLIGTIIFFAYQSAMWVGGFHKNLWSYSAEQNKILQSMSDAHLQEALYVMPDPNPNGTMDHNKAHDEMTKYVGKPWAMVFYHPVMHGEDMGMILKGLMHSLFAALIAAMVIYYGAFSSFSSRFFTGWSFGLFAIVQGPMNELNWWSFPWSFVQPQVIDLTVGWALCSIWLAWYVKRSKSASA